MAATSQGEDELLGIDHDFGEIDPKIEEILARFGDAPREEIEGDLLEILSKESLKKLREKVFRAS